jgi:farnesol dehydrogenase
VRVLLTGGTGYLGGAIREELARGGHRVVLLARTPADSGAFAASAGDYVPGDVTDEASVRRAMEGVDAVVHTAAHVKNWDRDRRRFDAVNVDGVRRVLAEAERARVSRVVYTSSFIAIGPSTGGPPLASPPEAAGAGGQSGGARNFRNDYERTKSAGHAVALEFQARGLPLTILYPTVVYGPGKRTAGNHVGEMLFALLEGTLPGLVGDGRPVWNFAYLPDVARGHRLALERGGSGRCILGGENLPVAAFVGEAARALGVPPPARRLGYALPTVIGALLEVVAAVRGVPPALTRGEVGIFRDDWAFESEAAERELGYTRTPLSRALAETARWVREERDRERTSAGAGGGTGRTATGSARAGSSDAGAA